MSPRRINRANATPPVAASDHTGRGFVRFRIAFQVGILLLAAIGYVPSAHAVINLSLSAAPGGIAMTPSGVNYSSSFGTVNALGIGPSSQAGVNIAPLSNGALYYSTYNLDISGGISGNQTVYVTAYVSFNFSHPAALVLESCPSTSSCNSASNFSAMSTNLLAQTTVIPSMGKNTPTTAGLAIFVPDNNGASAYTGNDTATITFTAFVNGTGAFVGTVSLSLNLPQETVQTAVRLQLATAPSGLTVNPAADYSMNFGNVNALGIGPGTGLATSPKAGGIIYSTPYRLLPAFTSFNSTSATIKVCVSTTFTHSAVLALEDSSTGSSGSFTNISTSCSPAPTLTSSASNRSAITRYLGLFVSNVNGPTAYTGTDTAILTYTLTVP